MTHGFTDDKHAKAAKESRVTLAKVKKQLTVIAIYAFRGTKLAGFTVAALLLVGLAALLISIIQFQIRIIEAKNQSRNFSLTSLTQSVAMQREFVDSVKTVQETEPSVSNFLEFQSTYFSETSRFVSMICGSLTEARDLQLCATGIASTLNSGTASQDLVYPTIARFIKIEAGKFPGDIKSIADAAITLAKDRLALQQKNEKILAAAKSACKVINQYVAGSLEQTLGTADKNSFIQSFSPEYVMAARFRCFYNWDLGAGLVSDLKKDVPKDTQQQPPTNSGNLESELAGALFFDLVAYFRFYEKLFNSFCTLALAASSGDCRASFGGDVTEQIVIAPIDISFVMLVIFCGALGAMLRISAENYNPKLFGKDLPGTKGSRMYYFVIGIMCSLIIYIIAKTVFAGLADSTYAAKSGNMSPFVIAFMAIVSGLMCEEAFQQIVRAGKSALARGTGADKEEPAKEPPG